ncbi:MAG: septal ring lytic transglycosylase RlpA family protein [Gammaproteobacteria bacterium]
MNFLANSVAALPRWILVWLLVYFAISSCSSVDSETRVPVTTSAAVDSTAEVKRNDSWAKSRQGNPPFYEVYGQRYLVMNTSEGYKERGVASWYGKKFHGRKTSNGEVYNMYAMTAAHKTLPLPTKVRVKNLRNGRSIVLRVNDRGPFVKNRLIDLSYAAAKQLDFVNAGTTLVEITAATYSAPAPTKAKSSRKRSSGSQVLYLQVGAFGQESNAQVMKQRLERNGMENVFIHRQANASRVLYRVRIGPISDVREYDKLVDRVNRLRITETHLVVEPRKLNSGNAPPSAG